MVTKGEVSQLSGYSDCKSHTRFCVSVFCPDRLFPFRHLHMHIYTVLLYTHTDCLVSPERLRTLNQASINFTPGWSISLQHSFMFYSTNSLHLALHLSSLQSHLFSLFPPAFHFAPLSVAFDGFSPLSIPLAVLFLEQSVKPFTLSCPSSEAE